MVEIILIVLMIVMAVLFVLMFAAVAIGAIDCMLDGLISEKIQDLLERRE